VPDEIIISEELEDTPLLEQHLRERRRGFRLLDRMTGAVT
jgi:hypothetical protein